ncbi:DUF998 domain-containing protein [Arthrobacter sp. CC3]|uniref:DUF998 domain-containing protein n=1 Tax=Arthrobacter sp. CC3 TaxID=3029185 RepID=UPI00326624C4
MSIDKRQPPLRRRAATHGSQPHEVTRKALLAAGALSSLLYVVATDVVAASRWDGYRRTEQMVSELFAVGSPGRDVLLPFTWLYTVLFTAFGVGVWISVRGDRALRIAGGLLIGYGLWNIMGALYPLTLGDDTSIPMHILATNVQLALMVAAMCFVAAGFHGRMRAYSIASLVGSAVMGMVAYMAAPGPNLVLGIGERISIGAFLLWVAVLAVALWKRPAADRTAQV